MIVEIFFFLCQKPTATISRYPPMISTIRSEKNLATAYITDIHVHVGLYVLGGCCGFLIWYSLRVITYTPFTLYCLFSRVVWPVTTCNNSFSLEGGHAGMVIAFEYRKRGIVSRPPTPHSTSHQSSWPKPACIWIRCTLNTVAISCRDVRSPPKHQPVD